MILFFWTLSHFTRKYACTFARLSCLTTSWRHFTEAKLLEQSSLINFHIFYPVTYLCGHLTCFPFSCIKLFVYKWNVCVNYWRLCSNYWVEWSCLCWLVGGDSVFVDWLSWEIRCSVFTDSELWSLLYGVSHDCIISETVSLKQAHLPRVNIN